MATVTPVYNWPVPTSTDYVKDGATAIESLGDAIDSTLNTALGGAYPGLRLVKKQTIGSAVSTITVTNAFSATYENYKIIVSGGASTVNTNFLLQLGATAGTSYRYLLTYANYDSTPRCVGNSATSSIVFAGNATVDGLSCCIEINSPFLTKTSNVSCVWNSPSDSGSGTGVINTTTSYTDFKLTTGAGTVTGGTIYVYGYGAS